jgi:DNA-binding NtrC family response regulator
MRSRMGPAHAGDTEAWLPLGEVERRYIERVLGETGDRMAAAARMLGISRWALTRRLRKHGLYGR